MVVRMKTCLFAAIHQLAPPSLTLPCGSETMRAIPEAVLRVASHAHNLPALL
jgi:hypothetical protein